MATQSLERHFENVVLISIDSLRFDAVRCLNREQPKTTFHFSLQTPLLDFFFCGPSSVEPMVVQSVLTPPSHASMFTGLIPPRHGVRLMYGTRLPPDVLTIAERLSAKGFRTIGSFDFDSVFRSNDLTRGFQSLYSCNSTLAVQKFNDTVREGKRRALLFLHLGDVHWPYGLGGKLTQAQEREVELAMNALLNQMGYTNLISRGSTPTLRAKGIREQLSDLIKDPVELDRVFSAIYDLGVSLFDGFRLTQIVDHLSDLSATDQKKTLFILTSDHGEGLHAESFLPKGGLPWFGHGLGLPRAVTQVPFCLATLEGPLDIPVRGPQTIDIVPTIFDLLGLRIDPSTFDGISLLGKRTRRIQRTESFHHLPIFWDNMTKIAAFMDSGNETALLGWLDKMVEQFQFSAEFDGKRIIESYGNLLFESQSGQVKSIQGQDLKIKSERQRMVSSIQLWKKQMLGSAIPPLGRHQKTKKRNKDEIDSLNIALKELGYF